MPDPYFVYILACADGSYYTGITNDLDRRVRMHNEGRGAKYTVSRRPVELVWSERHPSRSDALRRELEIKGRSRAEKEALVSGDPGEA